MAKTTTTPQPRTDLPGGGTTTPVDPKTGAAVQNPPAEAIQPPGGAPGDEATRNQQPAARQPARAPDHRKQTRDELNAKSRVARERIVAQQDSEHPEVADQERTAEAEMRGDIKHPGDHGYVPPVEPAEGTPAATTTPGAPPAQNTPPAGSKGIDTSTEFTTVKVYGVERQVPTKVVMAAGGVAEYQKALATEERQASQDAEARRQAESEQARVGQGGQPAERSASRPAGETVTPPPNPGAGADRKAQAAALVKRLYSGDSNQAEAAVEEILGAAGNNRPALTPEQVAEQVVRTLEQRESARTQRDAATQTEAARVSANAVFKTGYPELAKDEAKTAYAQQILKRKLALPENAGKPLEVLVVEAADQAMEEFNLRRPAEPGTTMPAPLADELNRRDQVKRIAPFGAEASARSPAPATETRPMTRAEVVAQMRKDRGLPPGG